MTILAMPALKEVGRSPAAPFPITPNTWVYTLQAPSSRKTDKAADWSLAPSSQSPEDNTLWGFSCAIND